ncbi:MAG: OmpA family protein [Flavobacteriales bacterium]
MRRVVLFPLLLVAVSAMGQQDLFKWRVAAHSGIDRSLSDIESSYSDVNWERSRTFGLELSKSLGYGVSLGLGVEQARLSGYDVLTGRKDRALNFMTELKTAQLELGFRMDNGKLLKYNARFAPFFTIGVGMGQYDVFGDLYSASGSRYYYWDDGTIRDQAEGGSNASTAKVISTDGNFETRLTDLATEDGKPKDQLFIFIPARIGLKWRICDRMAAELFYGFNWTFTDWIDDVHDSYPQRPASNDLAYITNPTGRSGQRGDPSTNDKYQSIGLNLAYYFGRRSTSYRMEPIYVDDRSLPPPPPKPVAAPKPSPVPRPQSPPAPTNVVINVERITVGSLSVDTLVVGTLVQRRAPTRDIVQDNSIRKTKLDSIMAREAHMDSLRFDTLRKSLPQSVLDSTMHAHPDSLTVIAPDSLRSPLPKAKVVMTNDTVVPMPMDTLRGTTTDTIKTSLERNKKRVENDAVLKPDTLHQVRGDSLKSAPAPVRVKDTLQAPYPRTGSNNVRVDTVYVDRVGPVAGYGQQAPNITQQPQQVIARQEPRDRSRTTVVPVPVIRPSGKTKTVADPALQDSLKKMAAENVKLHHLADSLRKTTQAPIALDSATTPLATSIAPELSQAQRSAFLLNDLQATRIATLERYIAVMDDQGSAAQADSLKQRIAAMDRELEELRGKGRTSNDGATKGPAGDVGQTLMDSISFSSGSSRVGSTERVHLMKMGKKIASGKVERVLVTGQTDRSGDPAFNLQLSQKRADAVKQVLVEAGVPVGIISAKGLGDKLAQRVHDESERVVVVQVVMPTKQAAE